MTFHNFSQVFGLAADYAAWWRTRQLAPSHAAQWLAGAVTAAIATGWREDPIGGARAHAGAATEAPIVS